MFTQLLNSVFGASEPYVPGPPVKRGGIPTLGGRYNTSRTYDITDLTHTGKQWSGQADLTLEAGYASYIGQWIVHIFNPGGFVIQHKAYHSLEEMPAALQREFRHKRRFRIKEVS